MYGIVYAPIAPFAPAASAEPAALQADSNGRLAPPQSVRKASARPAADAATLGVGGRRGSGEVEEGGASTLPSRPAAAAAAAPGGGGGGGSALLLLLLLLLLLTGNRIIESKPKRFDATLARSTPARAGARSWWREWLGRIAQP